MIDSLALPERSFDDLHEEVLRRSGRFRSARRRRAAVVSTALGSVLTVLVATAGGPLEHSVSTPAGPGATEDVVVDATAAPSVPVPSGTTRPGVGAGGATPAPSAPPAPSVTVPAQARTTLRTWVLFQQDGVLYEIDPATRAMRVAHAGSAPAARWSRDGRSLVLAHQGDLLVVEPGRAARLVFDGSDRDAAGAPAWMPDGRSLVFVRSQGLIDKVHELWTVEVAGGRLSRARAVSATATPAVGLDGRIAYQCPPGVCLTDRSGAHLGVIPGSGSYSHLAWSPDGRWIAATSGSLVAFRPDGSGHHVVMSARAGGRPVWFADSARIAVDLSAVEPLASGQSCPKAPCPADTGIWSVALDGTDARQVVAAPQGALMDARA